MRHPCQVHGRQQLRRFERTPLEERRPRQERSERPDWTNDSRQDLEEKYGDGSPVRRRGYLNPTAERAIMREDKGNRSQQLSYQEFVLTPPARPTGLAANPKISRRMAIS